jgi:hypothetical protein
MKARTKYLLVLTALLLAGEGWLVSHFLARQRGADFRAAETTPGDSAAPAPAAHCLDLSSYFNDSLDEGWQHQLMPGNNLATLPRGRQVFGGVEFEVQGIIQLTSPQLRRFPAGARFPEQVQGIPVSRKCRKLHFLHATGWNVAPGTQVGSYNIVYTDGLSEEAPILYGDEAGNWWAKPADMQQPGAGVIWQGTNAAKQAVQLFMQSWINPRPDVEITSLDFESRMTRVAPFLIAVTAE